MKQIALLFVLGVCACAGPTGPDLGQSANQCRYGSRPFVEAWPCVRDTFATRRDNHPDVQASFLARGDVIWENAKAGQITEPQARAEIRLAAANARAAEAQADGQSDATAAVILSGMRPYTPPAAPAQVNCIAMGAFTNCYGW